MATKKTPPAAPKKPRSDYKAGTRVKVILRNGSETTGRVASIKTTPTGPFIAVTIAGMDKPYDARPAKVRGY